MNDAFTDQPPPGGQQPRLDQPRPDADVEMPRPGGLAGLWRANSMVQAKWTLIAVGILLVLIGTILLIKTSGHMREGLDKALAKRAVQPNVDPEQLEQIKQAAVVVAYVWQCVPIAIGILFVFFGLLVYKFPIPITITALSIFTLLTVASLVIEPMALADRSYLTAVIFFGLYRAMRAAFAAERAKREHPELQGDA